MAANKDASIQRLVTLNENVKNLIEVKRSIANIEVVTKAALQVVTLNSTVYVLDVSPAILTSVLNDIESDLVVNINQVWKEVKYMQEEKEGRRYPKGDSKDATE